MENGDELDHFLVCVWMYGGYVREALAKSANRCAGETQSCGGKQKEP